ncbi:hypothetical protein NL676_009525 [Syzygium grande]|nr:hypothetical protein NL676_009525 [Syzygium grande]
MRVCGCGEREGGDLGGWGSSLLRFGSHRVSTCKKLRSRIVASCCTLPPPITPHPASAPHTWRGAAATATVRWAWPADDVRRAPLA